MRPPLREAIRTKVPLISDGGMGTELQKAGLEPGGCGELWNIAQPEKVAAVHRAYLAAGAQLLTTNTFGANRFVLARYGLAERQEELVRAGARITRQVAGSEAWVMGSVGPCGGFLEPLGEVSVAALEESLRAQMRALLEEGVDAILLETMTAADELEISLRVAAELRAPCVIASLAYDRVRGGFKTMMGLGPADAARLAAALGAHVVGANCGTELAADDFLEIARAYREACDLPLLLQPNGGTPRLVESAIVYDIDARGLARGLCRLARCAQIVGGCCGVGPEHIRAFRNEWEAQLKS